PALMAATLAPTINALEGSVMRPVSEAFVDCARRTVVDEIRKKRTSVEVRRMTYTWGLVASASRLLPEGSWVNTKMLWHIHPSIRGWDRNVTRIVAIRTAACPRAGFRFEATNQSLTILYKNPRTRGRGRCKVLPSTERNRMT